MELALEAGAEDVRDSGDQWEIVAPAKECHTVRTALEKFTSQVEGGLTLVANTTVPVSGETAQGVLKLLDMLDDLDDVQQVSANFDIPEEELAA
jgi:transcriptional/translational regulatory protein YebC/TACO1